MGRFVLLVPFAILISETVAITTPNETPDDEDGKEIMEAVDIISQTTSVVQNPSVHTAGEALKTAAALSAAIPAPPANFVIAGVLGVTGALMSAFGDPGPQPPSNQDVIDAMNRGFDQIDVRLDAMSSKVDQIYDLVHQLYDQEVLSKEDIDKVRAVFKVYIGYLNTAQYNPQEMWVAEEYAKNQNDDLAYLVSTAFSPSNVDQLMASQTTCRQMSDAYQETVSARYELYSLIFHAHVYMNGKVEGNAAGAAVQLKEDLIEYQQQVDKHHVPVSTADKNDCDRSVNFHDWKQITPGWVSNIAVDGDYLYGISAGGAVFRAPKNVGSWTQITPASVTNIVVDGAYLYGISPGGAVFRAPKNGGSWTQITPVSVTNIAVDGDYLYGISPGGAVFRAPKRAPLWQSSWTQITPVGMSKIAVDGDYLYGIGESGAVFRAPKRAPLWQSSWTQIAPVYVIDIAVDEFYLYGISLGHGVFRVPKSGGISWTQILVPDVTEIVVDNGYVYGIGKEGVSVAAANADQWWNTPRKQLEPQQLAGHRPVLV